MSATRSKYAPITPAERDRIVETHLETGWSAWRVATTLGHDHNTVVGILVERCGYAPRGRAKYDHAEILKYFLSHGRNFYGTAKHFGCDRNVVRYALKRYETGDISLISSGASPSNVNIVRRPSPKVLSQRIRPTNAWAEASSFEVREIIGDIMGVAK